MVSITITLDDELKAKVERLKWVNWSEISREGALKKEIFEEYIKTGKFSDEDWKFCDKIDWHPVDWLPLKKEFVKELESAKKETPIRYKSVDEFFETIK